MTTLHHLRRRLWETYLEVLRQIRESQLLLVASSLAYTTILSIIPAIAMSFAIFKAFGGLERLETTVESFILSNLTEGSGEQAIAAIQGFIRNVHGTALGVGGLLGLIVTTMSMLSSIEGAINRVWKTPNSRTWFQRISSYWLFITLGPVVLAVAVGAATTSTSALGSLIPSGVAIFTITSAIFFAVFKWVPSRKVHSFSALVSAILTAAAWNLGQFGYAIYTARAVSYNRIYGSLAAVPILLLWIYIAWLIVLSGVALSAALQHHFERDGRIPRRG